MNPATIRILLVDDHPSVRHGLAAVITTAPDMVVVGEAGDGLTAVLEARRHHPDVIIMDLVMPGQDGLEALKIIRRHHPEIHILVLTNFAGEQQILDALNAGVAGYLLKDAILTDIVEAVRRVATGQLILHPSVHQTLLQANLAGPQTAPFFAGDLRQMS